MPANAISGPDSEKIWDRAKKAADDQYGGMKSSNPDKYYAIVMTIYKNMCTKHNCKPKAEGMTPILRKLELFEDEDDLRRMFSAISQGIAEAKSKVKRKKSLYLKDRHEFIAVLRQYAKDISEIAKELE